MIHLLLSSYGYFGLSGVLLIVLAVLLSAAVYAGRNGERYSPFNHFISELGQVGVSRGAPVFNAGLIAGGLILLPFITGLGVAIESLWARLGMLAGIGAAVACMLIGVFPMNRLAPHTKAAMAYFRLGLATIVLFSLGIFFQPAGAAVVPPVANFVGLAAALAYASFLIWMGRQAAKVETSDMLNPGVLIAVARPRFWVMAMLEWAVFLSTMLWFLCIAVLVIR